MSNLLGCRVIPCKQGSLEWHMARAGVITASNFYEIRKRPTSGKNVRIGFTEAALKLAFRLSLERVSKRLLESNTYENWAMKRGHELEPEARREHQIQAGVIVEQAGFVLSEDGKFGASADGFVVGEDAGAEYKCLVDPDRMRAVLIDEELDEFMDQMQGGMWLTGLSSWHYGLFCPQLADIGGPLWWRVIPRDDNFIEAMEEDLLRFEALVTTYETKLRRVRWSPDTDNAPPWDDFVDTVRPPVAVPVKRPTPNAAPAPKPAAATAPAPAVRKPVPLLNF